jgi:hypothetical protein
MAKKHMDGRPMKSGHESSHGIHGPGFFRLTGLTDFRLEQTGPY